jgi:hypothetical protein
MSADASTKHTDTIIEIAPRPKLRALSLDGADAVRPEPRAETNFKIRLANTEGRRSLASYLIKRQYAWRGYEVGALPDMPANRVTLAAFGRDEHPIATITVGLDSSAGLTVETIYPQEVHELRESGRRLAEFTKLAVDNMVRSKAVLAAIFHIAYIYAYRIRGATDLMIEVNPRHVRFYEAMLGFEKLGDQRLDPRVNAPAVLLRLALAHAETQIAHYGGHPEIAEQVRSLYPLFFSPAEEHGIQGRLVALD